MRCEATLYLQHEYFKGIRADTKGWLREVGLRPTVAWINVNHGFVTIGMATWAEVDQWVDYLKGIEGLTAKRTDRGQNVMQQALIRSENSRAA